MIISAFFGFCGILHFFLSKTKKRFFTLLAQYQQVFLDVEDEDLA